MRDLVSRERIPSTQDTGRGRLKSITDAIRFTRRTSTSSKTTKVASGEFSYNDMLIVSETIRLQGCACLHWRVRAFGSSGARAFVCSCVRVLVRSSVFHPCFLPFSLFFPLHLEHTYVSLFCVRLFLQTEWETHCHFCHSSSIEESPLNRCRICPRVYHTDCLAKRGHLSGDGAAETLTLANSEIGWSCWNCVS